MNLSILRNRYKKGILTIAKQYKADNIRVFGSLVRGEEGPDSDIDFLVKFKPGTDLFDIGGMYEDLVELLKCDVDIISETAISPYYKEDVLREAQPL